MRNVVSTIIFVFLMLYLGCFKRQDYGVDEPEWPRYDVGGIVLDSITKESVEGCTVTIERWQLYFSQDDFISASDTTDTNGVFLVDSVAPGLVYINFEKEGYCSTVDSITVWLPPYDSLNYVKHALLKVSDAPNIGISLNEFNITLDMGETLDTTLIIFNSGKFTLDWTLYESPDDVDWLSENPMHGSIASQDSQRVSLNFTTTHILEYGVYSTNLVINSNDCDEPTKEIAVHFTIQQ